MQFQNSLACPRACCPTTAQVAARRVKTGALLDTMTGFKEPVTTLRGGSKMLRMRHFKYEWIECEGVINNVGHRAGHDRARSQVKPTEDETEY